MPIRIHQLAKELGLESKMVMEFLEGRGVSVQGHFSSIKDDEAELVRIFLEPDGESVNQPAETPETLVHESVTQADEVPESLNFENDDPEILAGDTGHDSFEETTSAFTEVIKDTVPEDLNVFTDDQFPQINEAIMSWKAGDVYSAWKVIGEVCAAPWVHEVLESLDLREPLIQKRNPEEEARWQDERARKIRTDIEEELSRESSVEGDPPPLKESVNTLKRFLKSMNENDAAIAWLRDSARHTVERLSEASEAPLKVAILGEFSSGKSRLINALLGEKILSIGLVPVTRSVTRIVYGDDIRVTVKHLDGTAVDVPPDQLKAFTDERKKEDGASEVEEVILEYPAPLLKQVEIWDTPGFNSNNQLHDQVAAQLMLEADAVLWVIAAHQVGSRSETRLLETVKRAQGKVVGVLNQIDRLENSEAIEQQKSEAWNHYGEMIKEVVPTSGKWLEENREEANRGLLLGEIEKIGSWSQEQRNRKEARRVATVAKQCQIFDRLKVREAEKMEKQRRQLARSSQEQQNQALQLWREALQHRNKIHKPTFGPEDRWWETNCAYRVPLTSAYLSLRSKKMSENGFHLLTDCLFALEEVNWSLSTHNPVPWQDDFLISWKKADCNAKISIDSVYEVETTSLENHQIFISKMINLDRSKKFNRYNGYKNASSKLGHVFQQLKKVNEVEKALQWAKTSKNISVNRLVNTDFFFSIQNIDELLKIPSICWLESLDTDLVPFRNHDKLKAYSYNYKNLAEKLLKSRNNLKRSAAFFLRNDRVLTALSIKTPKISAQFLTDDSFKPTQIENRIFVFQQNIRSYQEDQIANEKEKENLQEQIIFIRKQIQLIEMALINLKNKKFGNLKKCVASLSVSAEVNGKAVELLTKIQSYIDSRISERRLAWSLLYWPFLISVFMEAEQENLMLLFIFISVVYLLIFLTSESVVEVLGTNSYVVVKGKAKNLKVSREECVKPLSLEIENLEKKIKRIAKKQRLKMQLGDQLFKTIKHKEVFEKDLQEFQKNKICFQSKMNESFEELRLFETHD